MKELSGGLFQKSKLLNVSIILMATSIVLFGYYRYKNKYDHGLEPLTEPIDLSVGTSMKKDFKIAFTNKYIIGLKIDRTVENFNKVKCRMEGGDNCSAIVDVI